MNAQPSRDILVRALGVSRRYGTTLALDAASLTVRAGDRIALVGRSGSGKSTLLHLLAGLEVPTGGTIEWPALGSRDNLRRSDIAMVMQSPSLIAWLTVRENVALPAQLAGRGASAMAEADRALNTFGLSALAAKLPEEISGGQAQRVALVRATINGPALLLADEPTGQVDHATGKMLVDALFAWADRTDAAIVVATHDLAIAGRFQKRLEMDHGRTTTPLERIAS